jgi:hypothetical protein
VHKSSLVGLALGGQFSEAHIPTLQACTTDADAGSDMPCRGDVVAVVLANGMPSPCAVLKFHQGKDQPCEATLTEARIAATHELEVLHLYPVESPEQASKCGGYTGLEASQGARVGNTANGTRGGCQQRG